MATIDIPDSLYARLLSLGCATESFYASALEEALDRRRSVSEKTAEEPRKAGRPAPPVPKSKRSLYLDEQVWQALESKQIPGEGISAHANRVLRRALITDEN